MLNIFFLEGKFISTATFLPYKQHNIEYQLLTNTKIVTTNLIEGSINTYTAGSNVTRTVSEGIKLQYVKYIILPSSITEIPTACFYKANIKNVVLPESLTKIGVSAFEDCGPMKDIVIPDKVVTIGGSAFDKCASEIIVIGKSVTSIGSYAFSNFKKIYCKAINPPSIYYNAIHYGQIGADGSSSFGSLESTKSTILIVPRGCREAYRTSKWGKVFTDVQEVDFEDLDY